MLHLKMLVLAVTKAALVSNVPSYFLKSVCAQNFCCATFTRTRLYMG